MLANLLIILGVVWVGVFVCRLIDQMRGVRPADFGDEDGFDGDEDDDCGDEEGEAPGPPRFVPLWRHIAMALLGCLFLTLFLTVAVIFAVCILAPMMLADLVWRLFRRT